MALMDYLGEAIHADAMAKMKNQQNNAVKNEGVETVPPTTASSRPYWMNEDDWKAATQYYSPERINQLYKNFDPNSVEPFYQTLYKSTRHFPQLPEEKRVKAANNIASAADGLKLIVQGIAGAKGAYIPKDDSSAQKDNDAYIQRLRDIYKVDRDRYDTGLYNSVLTDIEAARQGYTRDRSGLLGVIQNAKGLKNQRDVANAKNTMEADKFRQQQERLNTQHKEQIRHNKVMEGISERNADANVQRATKSSVGNDNQTEPYYDPNTGTTYQLKKNVFKTIYPRIFKEMENDVFKGDPSEKRKYKDLSPSERMNYVLAHWPDSPSAVRLMKELAISVDEGDKKNENQVSKKIGW
ncbi:hypothetical protein [Parabacteroides provencensis]|uniref:hypothetical protein n=1 Tax=Parabacteroides provencensis TaxID=1944636 RepID=UPI000C1448AB|nr:hypothetical protein [Parabacteroides provencensis]